MEHLEAICEVHVIYRTLNFNVSLCIFFPDELYISESRILKIHPPSLHWVLSVLFFLTSGISFMKFAANFEIYMHIYIYATFFYWILCLMSMKQSPLPLLTFGLTSSLSYIVIVMHVCFLVSSAWNSFFPTCNLRYCVLRR